MDEREIERAAGMLVASRDRHALFDRLPDELRPPDEETAYRIQDAVHRQLAHIGAGSVVGHKIGCTTPVMQAFLQIDSPCAGQMFTSTVYESSGTYTHLGPARYGVECEVAVRLGSDLGTVRDRIYGREDVRSAVASVMPAIEIVQDRYADYPSLDTPTLIADDFFHAGAVLGPEHTDFDLDELPGVTAVMRIDGVEVGHGVGSDVLGHPLDALAWLATHAAGRGTALRSGEVILLGSLVQTHWVARGSEVEIINDPLGTAWAHFD